MKQVLHIGQHILEVEGDLVRWEAHGACGLEDLRRIIEVGEELAATYGRYYSIIDAREGITVTPEARRYNAEWERAHGGPKALTVIFGANAFLRSIVTLVNRAAQLLLGRAPEVIFVKSEAEALAVVQRERERARPSDPSRRG